MEDKNKDIKYFSVKFNATIYCFSMQLPLSGKFVFEYPDKMNMTLYNVPIFLSSYKGIFKGLAPAGTAYGGAKRKYIRTEKHNEKTFHLIQINPPAKQNIKEIFMWVNDENGNPEYLSIKYRDGTTVESENSFKNDFKYSLPSSQKALLKSKSFSAKASVKYKEYKINQK